LALAVLPSLSRAALHIAHWAFVVMEKKMEARNTKTEVVNFLRLLTFDF